MALEHAHDNIRCNSVHPGIIATPIWGKIPTGAEGNRRNAPIDPRERAAMMVPLTRVGEAQDIANGVMFLCTEAANYMTGQELVIDGGITAGGRPHAAAAVASDGRRAAKGWIVVAALSGAISVTVGAFAAHGLDPRPRPAARRGSGCRQAASTRSSMRSRSWAWSSWCAARRSTRRVALAAQWLFLLGSVLFPGALYALAFGGPRWMGAVAPIGGAAFILGWLSLALAALMRPGPTDLRRAVHPAA